VPAPPRARALEADATPALPWPLVAGTLATLALAATLATLLVRRMGGGSETVEAQARNN
jgi:hypothetical protein